MTNILSIILKIIFNQRRNKFTTKLTNALNIKTKQTYFCTQSNLRFTIFVMQKVKKLVLLMTVRSVWAKPWINLFRGIIWPWCTSHRISFVGFKPRVLQKFQLINFFPKLYEKSFNKKDLPTVVYLLFFEVILFPKTES